MWTVSPRLVIRAGGCNCSRANYAGALVGAAGGAAVLLPHWLVRVTGIEALLQEVLTAAAMVEE